MGKIKLILEVKYFIKLYLINIRTFVIVSKLTLKFVMEQPGLSVIKEISGDDIDFENSILEIIKKEFPEEVEEFTENYKLENYVEASHNVHKVKHKISLLGLEQGLEIASVFELALKKGDTQLHSNFLEILDKIRVYLKD